MIRKLAGSLATEDNTKRSVRMEPTEIEHKVIEFYKSDLVCRQLPGRKDCVTVCLFSVTTHDRAYRQQISIVVLSYQCQFV